MTRHGPTRRVIGTLVAATATLLLLGPPLATEVVYRYQVGKLPAPLPQSTTPIPPRALEAFWVEAGEPLPMASRWVWKWHLWLVQPWKLPRWAPGERMASRAARGWLAERSPELRGVRWPLAWGAATVWMSRNRSAQEMTAAWIDRAYYGRGAMGLTTAAEAYFGKRPEALATHELALLIGLTQSPSRYNPDCRPEAARARRDYVLGRLFAAKVISQAEHDAAAALPLGVVPRPCAQRPKPAQDDAVESLEGKWE